MNTPVYKITDIGSGSLHVMPKPGSNISLNDDIANLKSIGIDRVVSLLEAQEASELGLDQEPALVVKHNMEFVSFPITDMALPDSVEGFLGFTKQLYDDCCAELNTVVHCRAGIGRSGMAAAGILMHNGIKPLDALELITTKRTVRVPDTEAQINWLVQCHNCI